MITYCDTSALMKLFVAETGSSAFRKHIQASQRVLVSALAWAEMLAALALKQRTGQIDAAQLAAALALLEAEWPRYHLVTVDTELITQAGSLALRFGLRAYDSVQLAGAWRAHQQIGPLLAFACFDNKLNAAAETLGIQLVSG